MNTDEGKDGDDSNEDGEGSAEEDEPEVVADPDTETAEQLRRRSFTIKKLVRLLHVRRPVEPVMAIIGKK